ncbi:autotransporter outer membrane beta-barrel domain-containing protein [Pseudomonas nicosulfuronedens]|uniref:Autotransporter outer membrane beta-barrel domain-containing protein n=1 Tax=Pseudomonas nicosulfuronedens TaxID=2571105 RepID=A0A5R9QQE9_9PSED|nr:autotransporter outer membrane beta-barrel domain-containing protein [Pseudomonas nicosulfuronedens]MDH1008466.1 autotransporter outer membrane beta-barrel domain-containing protein [Pseudomonas nicosulfuronedens]MDH1982003.1 autotransporter outer membrane beta-barrel domain-containing protein [Pseudomonas nicosulfuronedens]MDH2030403.1 autotransporter outer membrane beta-barrel domain-containing protein [Pseudomonas nicosulfuronedens]TLX72026.1 autotransporter outer membrane beta-barrel dom
MRFKKSLLAVHVALAFGLTVQAQTASAACSTSGNIMTCDTIFYDGQPTGVDTFVINTGTTMGSAGKAGIAIYGNSAKYNLAEATLTTGGMMADAIQANAGSSTISIDKLTIVTKSYSADGINVTENAKDSTVTIGNNASITTAGMGVRANTSKNGGTNRITLGDGATISTSGAGNNTSDGNGYAVYAGNRDTGYATFKGNAEVTLGDDSTITTKGSAAHAVFANRGGVIKLGSTDISTEKNNAYGIYAQTLEDFNGMRGGKVHLYGDTQVTVTDGNRAMAANGEDSSIVSENAAIYVLDSSAADDLANRKGVALYAENLGKLDLKMAAGSYFNGTTSTATDGVIDLAMDGAASQWFMTGNSNLTNLSLTDGAQLIYDRHDEHGAYTYKTLTVDGDFTGGGHLVMNTYLGNDTSETDKLAITGSTSGDTRVTVNNTDGPGAETLEGIQMITVGGTSAGEFKSDRVTEGGYEYVLRRGGSFVGSTGSNSDWYLTSYKPTEPEPEDPDPVDPGPEDPGPVDPGPEDPGPVDPGPEEPGPVDPGPEEPGPVDPGPEEPGPVDPGPTDPAPEKPTPSDKDRVRQPEGGSYTANIAAANTMFLHRLHDRTGNLTYIDPDTGKEVTSMLWMRNVDGSTRWEDSTGQLKTESNRYVLQLGSDLYRKETDNGDWVFGVMAGYANGNSTTKSRITGYRSRGEIDGYSLGVYGTWYENREDENGAYVDSWILYNEFDADVKGDQLAKESYDLKGITASVEAGKTFEVAKTESATYYVQPQAQIVYMGVKADNHREANGTQVTGKGDGNVMTRLGARAAVRSNEAGGFANTYGVEPYVETNWIHNSKDFGAKMGSTKFEMDGASDIFEVKLGATSKVNSRVNVWGEVGHQFGDNGYRDQAVTVGFKVNF